MKVFKVHVYLEGDVDTLEDAEETYATFIVMAKDEGQAEVLVKEYIQREELLKGDVETLEDFEAYATFIVMAKDEGQAEVLVKEYIKKENPPKGDVEILDVEEVPIDQASVLGLVVD